LQHHIALQQTVSLKSAETLGLTFVIATEWRPPMTTLTFSDKTFTQTSSTKAAVPVSGSKPGFGQRLMAAMIASRQRQAQIEIRRVQFLVQDKSNKIDYAMLPFGGE
jgi:hypothetical protein